MPTVAERVATALAPYADEMFGLLGNGNAFVVDAALRNTGTRFTAVRHEVATVASADAYYRATRKLAVATATYGAGFTNTLTALAEASMSRVPLVLLVGDAPTGGPRPWDVDQDALAAACDVATITVRADYAAAAVNDAVRRALADRRPVVLALPYDLPTATATEADVAPIDFDQKLASQRPEVDRTGLEALAADLAAAKRPIILGGRGALDARADLTALADRLGAITVTTAAARGLFAGRALDAGVCGGFSSERTAGYLAEADLIVAVGAGLNQFTMGFGRLFPQARLVQIDVLDAATHAAVDTYLRADAATAATVLNEALADAEAQAWPGLDATEVAAAQFDRPYGRTATEAAPAADGLAADGQLDPRALTAAIDRALPAERLITSDGGHFIGWANTYLDVPGPDSVLLVGTAFQSIGLGFSTAAGAARAANERGRMLVLPTGDGGGLMALADLDSLVRTADRATVIVYNDAAYTAEITQYGMQGLDERPMRIDRVSFAGLGQAVGARGTEVRTLDDLAEWATWAASGEPGTWVLDCRVSGEVIAPYQLEIMENLKRQVAATR
ncbi:thiamine pyrophosphate-binding protein [Gulosibacter faecalis]|jgi:thiamine pyrophosphate-dependent acetolactate synthase large subunit-like protein|uniref:Thiamine pyrophosphate-binding protein n=1 Tax=Gulosibacter faecalis TaxID=272240 RepID=A0ABW5UU34_9MICO|nr:thiamine pyrophosphate-binding protein [Gulosibacter faecalis]